MSQQWATNFFWGFQIKWLRHFLVEWKLLQKKEKNWKCQKKKELSKGYRKIKKTCKKKINILPTKARKSHFRVDNVNHFCLTQKCTDIEIMMSIITTTNQKLIFFTQFSTKSSHQKSLFAFQTFSPNSFVWWKKTVGTA